MPDDLDRTRLFNAAGDHDDDIDHLGRLDDSQLDYLARVGELPDEYTDGIDCDTDERPGG